MFERDFANRWLGAYIVSVMAGIGLLLKNNASPWAMVPVLLAAMLVWLIAGTLAACGISVAAGPFVRMKQDERRTRFALRWLGSCCADEVPGLICIVLLFALDFMALLIMALSSSPVGQGMLQYAYWLLIVSAGLRIVHAVLLTAYLLIACPHRTSAA